MRNQPVETFRNSWWRYSVVFPPEDECRYFDFFTLITNIIALGSLCHLYYRKAFAQIGGYGKYLPDQLIRCLRWIKDVYSTRSLMY